MKRLTQAFLWTCTAMLLGLFAIVTMSAVKGHFNRDTITRIVALLNGIDIQGERLKQAILEAKSEENGPLESPDPIAARNLTALQTDSRSAALDRYKKELDDRAQRLKDASDRHNALVAEFKKGQEEADAAKSQASTLQIKNILESLDPAVAKQQIITMLEKEQKGEVLSILEVLEADKLKKILGEFVDLADQQRIAEILEEIRVRGKLASSSPPQM